MSKAVKIQIRKSVVKPAVVCGVKLGCEWDGYEKTHIGEENIKKGTWTSGRARNMENNN